MYNHSLTFNFNSTQSESLNLSQTGNSGEPFTAKVLQESLEAFIQATMITKISVPSNDMFLFTEPPLQNSVPPKVSFLPCTYVLVHQEDLFPIPGNFPLQMTFHLNASLKHSMFSPKYISTIST